MTKREITHLVDILQWNIRAFDNYEAITSTGMLKNVFEIGALHNKRALQMIENELKGRPIKPPIKQLEPPKDPSVEWLERLYDLGENK